MRPWTWIPTLLLTTLLASPVLAQDLDEQDCLDLLWELAFEGSVPDAELEAFVGCLDLLDEALVDEPDPALDDCLDDFWSLVGDAPAAETGVLTDCAAAIEEVLDPEPESCLDILWGSVDVPGDEPVDPACRTCVMQLEQVVAQDPAVPEGVDPCIGSLWDLVNQDPTSDSRQQTSCLFDLEGWLIQLPAPGPQG